MANDVKNLSQAMQREVLSYESWLTATSGFRFEKFNRQSMLPTVSVYGNHKLKVDAVLVVGDNLRAAAEATDFLLHHKKMRGCYPEIICAPGFSIPAAIDFGYPAEWWLKVIMLCLGIPKELLKQHKLCFDRRDPCWNLTEFFAERRKIKTVVVFSSRGYSMTVAQELYQRIPRINWVFFDNPMVQLEDRIFDTENISSGGLGIDLLIGGMAHVWQDWGSFRYPLSSETRRNAPKKLPVKNLVHRGYVLGLESGRDWDFFEEDAVKHLETIMLRRRELVTGDKIRSRICGQVRKLIGQFAASV